MPILFITDKCSTEYHLEMTYDLDQKRIIIPGNKKVISAPWDTSLIEGGKRVRTFYMDMKLLCKVISETAGFFEKKKIRQFRCLQTDFIK